MNFEEGIYTSKFGTNGKYNWALPVAREGDSITLLESLNHETVGWGNNFPLKFSNLGDAVYVNNGAILEREKREYAVEVKRDEETKKDILSIIDIGSNRKINLAHFLTHPFTVKSN